MKHVSIAEFAPVLLLQQTTEIPVSRAQRVKKTSDSGREQKVSNLVKKMTLSCTWYCLNNIPETSLLDRAK